MSIELNAHNAKTVAKQIMKAKSMHIKSGFTPVRSAYTLSGASDRYKIELADDAFTACHEVQKGNKWIPIALNKFNGSFEMVEAKCMQFIELLTKNKYI